MKKLKELTVREEQDIQLQILHLFDDACNKESLCYFLAYGTLLGAVREKGFIAWDDDIDLWMPREDFERFQTVFCQYFDESRYFLQTYKTDKNTINPEMMRICVAGTYKWPEGCEKENFHTGLYFDVFPLDNGFGTQQDMEDLEKSKYYHKMLLFSQKRKFGTTLKEKLRSFVYGPMPRRYYTRKMVHLIDGHKVKKSNVMLSFPAAYAGLSRSYFESTYFEKTLRIPFEDMQVPVPERYDKLLRYMYGEDYMIPAVTKPHIVHAYLIEE